MTKQIIILLTIIGLTSCYTSPEKKLEPNLSADREAQIGWVYFNTYPDSTFDYALSKRDINKGTFKRRGDTLQLKFADTSIHLDRAIIVDDIVEFSNTKDTNYRNFASITLNKLTNNKP